MSTPVVFNITYTPYKLPKNATAEEIAQHASERAFYNLTGDKNYFDYMTTECKRLGKFTALEYFQKSMKVFNDKGSISLEEIDEMKERAKNNKGNIWHGFISLSEEDSYKIDTPEKCVALVRHIFPQFFADAKFHKNNVDLMCALHLDKPHHLHIHFAFWEKEPKYKREDNSVHYRRRGKIDKKHLDNVFVRLNLYLSDDKEEVHKSRDEAVAELRELLGIRAVLASKSKIQKEIASLARDLPKTGRLGYASKDMEKFRVRIDKIVDMLISSEDKAMKADRRFSKAVANREKEIQDLCRKNGIEKTSIRIVEDIKEDYKRRQGNMVLNLCKIIKPECLNRKRKHKANSSRLKRSLNISRNKIGRECRKFFKSFGTNSELLERDFTHRLQDIEEEMELERKEKEKEDVKVNEKK
ncbi:MAG: hypothetical protein NC548_61125 [Lachnospiraceae bacterium]|nr:hypothetical protein [Lachnospiraceae bacterium]